MCELHWNSVHQIKPLQIDMEMQPNLKPNQVLLMLQALQLHTQLHDIQSARTRIQKLEKNKYNLKLFKFSDDKQPSDPMISDKSIKTKWHPKSMKLLEDTLDTYELIKSKERFSDNEMIEFLLSALLVLNNNKYKFTGLPENDERERMFMQLNKFYSNGTHKIV